MKHAAAVHFRFSRPLTLLGLLMLIAANGGAGKTAAERPKTLGSLLQQMRGKPSQRKQSDMGKDVPSAPLFLEAPQYPTGNLPYSVVVDDFNGDGKDDLAVANYCSDDACSQSSVSVLLGNGDGTFQAHVDYLTGTGSVSIVVGDFNHDGRPDLAATNICSDPSCVASSVSILLGKGDGTFRAHVDYATGLGPLGIAVGDLNGDGKADLVTADYFDAVSVLLGKGDGTFQPNVDNLLSCLPDSNLCAPEAVAIADFNGDHKPDLATADYLGMRVSIFLGNGDGTFQPQSDQLKFLLSNPSAIAAADLNADGNIDLVVNDQNGNIADAIAVLPGKGDGTFPQKLGYRSGVIGGGDKPCSIAIADFNGDQKWDIANCNNGGNSVTVVLGNGDETFSYTRAWGTGDGPRAVGVGDFNGDGKKDIVAVNAVDNTVSVLLGNGDGTFYSRPDADWFAGAIPAAADFNGDGKVDLLTSGGVYSTLSLLLGRGDGTFEPRVDFDPGTGPAVTGDFNHDGKPDFAVVVPCDSSCTSSVRVYIGNGDGTFKPHVDYAVPITANFLAAADFNSDGELDLVVTFSTSPPTHGLRILLGNGDGTFHNFGDLTLEAVGNVVAADFNGDGKTDLATADEWNSSFNVLLGNGDGTFQAPVNYVVPQSLTVLAVGDINGDNKPDLIAGSIPALSVGLVSVYLGNGDGTFTHSGDYDPGISVWSLVMGDFDGDHHVDLAIGGADNASVNILRGNGDGTFNPPLAYTVGGAPGGLAVADFNADGKPDLAAPNYSYTASVLLNIANIPMFTLSAGINGSGSVRIDPGGTLCSANCSKSFATGTAIILTATADSGSSFSGWTGGGCSGTGTCNLTLTADQTITATFLTPEFSLSASDPAPNPISPGQSSTGTVNAAAVGGFSSAVSLTCSVQPMPAHAPQCSLNPNSITPDAPATLTITTNAPTGAKALLFGSPYRPFNALWLPIAGLALAGISLSPQRKKKTTLAGFLLYSLLVAGLIFQSACGGGGGGNGGGGGTPAGSYTITITGTSGSLHHSTAVTLNVQ